MNPSAAAIATGREVLKRIASYLASGVDFAVETTLSGASPMNLISTAKSRGCEIHLVFVGLDSRERCMREYEDGQHGEGITFQMPYVRRRYERALANVPGAIRSADIATFYDNSADKARLILIAKDGIVIWRAVPLPRWVSL
jgi:predicted ABC-type ATPase